MHFNAGMLVFALVLEPRVLFKVEEIGYFGPPCILIASAIFPGQRCLSFIVYRLVLLSVKLHLRHKQRKTQQDKIPYERHDKRTRRKCQFVLLSVFFLLPVCLLGGV